jgi:molybdate transport system permease protein
VIALLGVPLAYLLATGPRRVTRPLTVLVALPLALPPLMGGLILLYVVGPYTWLGGLFDGRLTDTAAGIVLAQTFVAAPFLVITARAAFGAIDPALPEVAASLGHGPLSRFWRFAVPAALPGIAAGLLLAWMRAFGEFGATVILAYHPYSLPVFTFVQFDATGLPGTMLPIAVSLGAALVVLTVAHLPLPRVRLPRRQRQHGPGGEPAPALPPRFSVSARAGEFSLELAHRCASSRIALLGASGAGKTLTLRSLLGTHPRARASVDVGGSELGHLPTERRRIGYVPQQSTLLPRRTVREQLLLGRRSREQDADGWIEALGLSGLEDRYPDQLSGGQQRRVALARALADRPCLLLLDEPFTGLDAPSRRALLEALRRLQDRHTCATLLVTHDPQEAALLAEEIILIDEGRLLRAGNAGDLLRAPAGRRSAELLGVRNANVGVVVAPGLLRSHGIEIRADTHALPSGEPVIWAIDPADVHLCGEGGYAGEVLRCDDLGFNRELTLGLADGLRLIARARIGHGQAASPGETLAVALDPDDILVHRDEERARLAGGPLFGPRLDHDRGRLDGRDRALAGGEVELER